MTSRRALLGGAAGLAALACLGVSGCSAESDPPGTHAALRRPRPFGTVAFLGVTGDRAAARDALRAAAAGDVMVGLGASLFTDATDPLAAGLTPMPPFVGDVLLPDRANPDAFVQVEGDDAEGCAARLDTVLAGLPGLSVRWRIPVHRDLAGTAGGRPLQRNPFGFVEGQANPAPDELRAAVLRPTGAALAAVRVIRMAQELWNTEPPSTQDQTIGRRADGTWLDGTPPAGIPRYADDPDGAVIPLTSHARTMNPRTPGTPAPRMLRRSWIYQGPHTPEGTPDEGVMFMAFQNDFDTGFALAQRRLPGDDLHRYLLTVGGGYFVVP